ncbi:MAG: ABC transporter permease [Nocardioides sp.]
MLIGTLLWRDLKARLRDRSALVLAIAAPAALITVLSFLVAGPDTQKIPVGIVTADSPVSTALEQGPLAALAEDDTLTIRAYADQAALRKAIEAGKVDGGVVVAPDGAQVTVLADAGSPVASAILEAVSRSTALTVDGITQAVVADRALGGSATPDELAAQVVAAPSPGRIADASEGADALDGPTQVAAGMATFFLFFTVQFGVLGLLEEKREGTLARILAAPVPPGSWSPARFW